MYLHDVLEQRRTHAVEVFAGTTDAKLEDVIRIVDTVITALLEDGDPRVVTIADDFDVDAVFSADAEEPIAWFGVDLGRAEGDITIIRANAHCR